MRNPFKIIAEFVIPSFDGNIRSVWRRVSNAFWGTRPFYDNTVVDVELCRQLYRNDGENTNLGAGFCKPIVDLSVEYMGVPYVNSGDGSQDNWLNECIHNHWAPQLNEVWRNAIRDSKTWVRFRQPRIDNPLFTEQDRLHGRIETIDPERVDIIFAPDDPDFIAQAVVRHNLEVDERTQEDIFNGMQPRIKEHEILEFITPELYRFFDNTEKKWIDAWTTPNVQMFVPIWPCYNEYDSTLSGGQSDLESIVPFIRAFHEVMLQAIQAHHYHSTPKLYFKVNDWVAFLKANFPETIDNKGQLVSGAAIKWQGKEVLFVNANAGEEIGFIEAKSVLGDSKVLLDFLIDCICMASETPRWALLKESKVPERDASVMPFEKKVERKRRNFQSVIQMIVKMALAASGQTPVTVRVSWPVIRLDDLVAKGQAIQQIILGFDVASSHEWMADETIVSILATIFPEINSPDVEKRLAANNVVPQQPATSPQSATQALPPVAAKKNGSGPKQGAQAALATTKASAS